MEDLIKSLQILKSYCDAERPIWTDSGDSSCLHVTLNLINSFSEIEHGDNLELQELGWHFSDWEGADGTDIWTYRYTP
jgi:hypothetical protein